MLRCNEVTKLCASGEIPTSSLMTRAAVRMHLLLCRYCRRYVRELRRIGEAVRAMMHSTAHDADQDEALVRRVLEKATPERS